VKSLGTGTVKDHYYFNEDWQELEVRKETSGTISANPFEQFVWHPYYIDALATRFYDSDVNTPTGVVQHYFTHDANFNATSVVDTSGNVVERYDYSPYGEPIFLDANFDFDADSVSDIAHSRTYTGQRLDTETGLYQYRNRYYHAKLGRFISRDPIGYEGSKRNLYEYLMNQPLSLTDPTGLCPLSNCNYKDRTPIPGRPSPAGEGCTSSPDIWHMCGKAIFVGNKACNPHDVCYGTCGKSQAECDIEFLQRMMSLCDANFSGSCWTYCMILAYDYYTAVYYLGGNAYDLTQDENCRCP
jgi:RHS repeat-associated protein